jgi:CDP-diacylglycerol--glycerol-3-phosphate 3-phosphatidyltransferase
MRGRAYHPGASLARFSWANAITATRLLIVVPCVMAILQQAWLFAVGCFAYAVASDFADGAMARRRNEASAFGGLFDHSADAFFVSAALAAFAVLGEVPPLLPVLIAVAFAQYVWDSDALSGAVLRASTLGRWNGIAYYVFSGALVIGHAALPDWPARVSSAGAWLLVVSTALSMTDRAVALWRLRR